MHMDDGRYTDAPAPAFERRLLPSAASGGIGMAAK